MQELHKRIGCHISVVLGAVAQLPRCITVSRKTTGFQQPGTSSFLCIRWKLVTLPPCNDNFDIRFEDIKPQCFEPFWIPRSSRPRIIWDTRRWVEIWRFDKGFDEGIVLIVLDRFTEDFCAMFLLCYDLVPWWTKSPFMMFHEDLLEVLSCPVDEKHAEPRWSFPCRFGTQPSLHLSQTPQLSSQMCQAFDLPDTAFLATLSVWYPAMTSNPPTKQPKLFLNSVVQSVRYFHVLLALSFYFHTWECDCDWLCMEHHSWLICLDVWMALRWCARSIGR